LALPILNILVPQVGHTPWVAGRPFFIVISLVSFYGPACFPAGITNGWVSAIIFVTMKRFKKVDNDVACRFAILHRKQLI
jgi:hypothetical protein